MTGRSSGVFVLLGTYFFINSLIVLVNNIFLLLESRPLGYSKPVPGFGVGLRPRVSLEKIQNRFVLEKKKGDTSLVWTILFIRKRRVAQSGASLVALRRIQWQLVIPTSPSRCG
jgi:hypothetical protein